ncbi:MAG: GIY-YIG nuclease family protein [Candidatus Acidiferrales bacterium]
MAFLVYVLLNPDGKTYVGHTSNLSRRLSQHNDSDCRLTLHTKRHPGPWRLLHCEQFPTRSVIEAHGGCSTARTFQRERLPCAVRENSRRARDENGSGRSFSSAVNSPRRIAGSLRPRSGQVLRPALRDSGQANPARGASSVPRDSCPCRVRLAEGGRRAACQESREETRPALDSRVATEPGLLSPLLEHNPVLDDVYEVSERFHRAQGIAIHHDDIG